MQTKAIKDDIVSTYTSEVIDKYIKIEYLRKNIIDVIVSMVKNNLTKKGELKNSIIKPFLRGFLEFTLKLNKNNSHMKQYEYIVHVANKIYIESYVFLASNDILDDYNSSKISISEMKTKMKTLASFFKIA